MKIIVFLFVILAIAGVGVIGYYYYSEDRDLINPLSKGAITAIQKPLEKYQIGRLKEVEFKPSEIKLGEVISEDEDEIITRMFYFQDRGAEGNSEGLRVSGLMNYPKEEGSYPVIVMFRGFVERSAYSPGEGTRRSGEELAKNGFVTLAPDFLGYGESEMPSQEPLEERFQTYTTALSLLSSLSTLNNAFKKNNETISADLNKIGVFAHSNGGQIAVTSVGVSGEKYPTVLWAPVTKPFPYNILYFTDEYEDQGKALRKLVADFEKDYDVFEYSIFSHLDLVNFPLQIHQGEEDESIPKRWSDQFVSTLEDKGVNVEYFIYPGENHNFNNGSWPVAIERSIEFFQDEFKE